MSNDDPFWSLPQPDAAPGTYRPPRPVAVVLAVALPLLLIIALATPFGLIYGLSRLRTPLNGPGIGSGTSTQGQPGVGDPYFPDYGSSGYDALKYTIDLGWDARHHTLTATTLIDARATQTLTSFYFDLALHTDQVLVNGDQATFAKSGFQDVRVTPATPIAAGADFDVLVTYSGDPATIKRGDTTPWSVTGQEWTAAGEPESSAWWFPADDHPSDPALMDVTATVPEGMEAISVGRLESVTHEHQHDAGDASDVNVWHWVAEQPMATYLNFLSIGQYALEQGVVDGRPYVYAVSEQLSPQDRQKAFAALQKSGAIVRTLESMFGPYPFSELGGVVPAHKLQFGGLESQTRPVYARSAITGDGATTLIAHELTHMWFGDNVTVHQWNDIFMNEGYAAWAQWGYTERTGGRSANAAMNADYDRLSGQKDFWQITMIDPGKDHLFDAVYDRGPMALQALRNVMGDEAFFALAREWGDARGSRSLEQWMVAAQAKTTVDLKPFFQAWIYSPTQPARTAANGFR